MVSLASLVNKYFPEEKITQQTKIYLEFDNQIISPKHFDKPRRKIKEPIDMIETDQKYYFDLRQSSRFPSVGEVLSLILKMTFPGIIIIFIFRIWSLEDYKYFLIGLAIFVAFIYLLIWWGTSGLNRVELIAKEWIKNKYQTEDSLVLEGEFQAPLSSSLPYFLKASKAGISESKLFMDLKSSFKLTKAFTPMTTKFKFILRNQPPRNLNSDHIPLFQTPTQIT